MRLTARQTAILFGVVAGILAIDNFRLRVTCHVLEKAVNYAMGGIHLDGVGGIYDEDDVLPSEADSEQEV